MFGLNLEHIWGINLKNNTFFKLIINGKDIIENQDYIEGVKIINLENRILEFQNQIKSKKLIIQKLYKIEIESKIKEVNKSFELTAKCENSEMPFIISKELWDKFENQKLDEYNFLSSVFNTSKSIPGIFPTNREIINNDNVNMDEFFFSNLDFFNLFKKIDKENNHSLYFFTTKLLENNELEYLGLNQLIIKNNNLEFYNYRTWDKYKKNNKKNIIFIHGIASTVGENFRGLYECLKTEFNIFSFNYCSVGVNITDNGKLLKEFISGYFENEEVHIFAHSMGGLVSRSAIVEHNASVKNLVMAGTPNNGATIAKIASKGAKMYAIRGLIIKVITGELFGFLKLTEEDIMCIRSGKINGLIDLIPNSEFLLDINKMEKFAVPYFLMAGSFGALSRKSDGIVNKSSMCTINNLIISHQIIENCFHTKYFNYKRYNELKKDIDDIRSYMHF